MNEKQIEQMAAAFIAAGDSNTTGAMRRALASGWIANHEQPEIAEPVWICTRRRVVKIGCRLLGGWESEDGCYYADEKITHWMPICEPPPPMDGSG